jgi:hypothetical protein
MPKQRDTHGMDNNNSRDTSIGGYIRDRRDVNMHDHSNSRDVNICMNTYH